MKRFLIMIMALFALVALSACGKKEYPYDGKFIAFETSLDRGAPQLTWVEVTVEDGKVTKYFIDELQTTAGVWNEKTKKELKEDYGMKKASDIEKEWYEQAAAIEAFFLSDGPKKLSLDDEGKIDNITDATMIGTSYQKLALEALEKAKKGIYTAFETSLDRGAPQLTWVEVTYKKGKVSKYFIDELQTTDGVWNEKTKKELKEEYGMIVASPIEKEWYEQAAAIEAFFLSDGPDKLELDDGGKIDNITDATMIGTSYKELAIKALSYKK